MAKVTKGKFKGKGKSKKKARQRELPTMEGVRYTDLDAICESISSHRRKANKAKQAEAEDLAAALPAMQEHKVKSYLHDGVVLTVSGGDMKVKAKLVSEKKAKDDVDDDGGDEKTDE